MAPVLPPSAAATAAAGPTDTYRIGGHKVSYALLSTMKQASNSTGVDFAYLVAQAGQESGFRTNAQASTSSARGLFQFIESTWLEMVRDHGAKYGLAAEAQQIRTGSDGRPRVDDLSVRRSILSLRDDPRIASAMAAEYARSNQQILSREVGVDLNRVDLYLGHFLGPNGASRFLTAMRQNPAQDAAALLPEAAAANRNVFYTPDGRPRSVGDVYAFFGRKLDSNATGLDSVPDSAVASRRASPVNTHLAEQRRVTDHAVQMMAMDMLQKLMQGQSRLTSRNDPDGWS